MAGPSQHFHDWSTVTIFFECPKDHATQQRIMKAVAEALARKIVGADPWILGYLWKDISFTCKFQPAQLHAQRLLF